MNQGGWIKTVGIKSILLLLGMFVGMGVSETWVGSMILATWGMLT